MSDRSSRDLSSWHRFTDKRIIPCDAQQRLSVMLLLFVPNFWGLQQWYYPVVSLPLWIFRSVRTAPLETHSVDIATLTLLSVSVWSTHLSRRDDMSLLYCQRNTPWDAQRHLSVMSLLFVAHFWGVQQWYYPAVSLPLYIFCSIRIARLETHSFDIATLTLLNVAVCSARLSRYSWHYYL